MKLKTREMKVLKILHLLFVMIWIVGILSMWVLSFLSPKSGDELYMLLASILWVDYTLTIPGAICTLLTGIIYGLFTNWGFFKYRWITVKWIVSILVVLVGTFCFHPSTLNALEIAERGRNAALGNIACISALTETKYLALIQAGVLIFLVAISVFKPFGKNNIKKKTD